MKKLDFQGGTLGYKLRAHHTIDIEKVFQFLGKA